VEVFEVVAVLCDTASVGAVAAVSPNVLAAGKTHWTDYSHPINTEPAETWLLSKREFSYALSLPSMDINWKPELWLSVWKKKTGSISLATGFWIYLIVIFVKEITYKLPNDR